MRQVADLRLIEIGAFDGDSARVFGRYFSEGKVLAVDIEDKKLDFSEAPNITFKQADQTNEELLQEITVAFAPNGVDILIDDASHFGWHSKLTFDALFSSVKPGGLYIVEDWGTGYIGDWHDGGPFEPLKSDGSDFPKRLPSHDYGMVGFVKSLIDGVWAESIRPTMRGAEGPTSPIASMHVHKGLVVLKKRETVN